MPSRTSFVWRRSDPFLEALALSVHDDLRHGICRRRGIQDATA